EISPGLRCKEDKRLLSAFRNRDDDPFLAHVLVPGFDLRKPIFGRRIGRSAKENGNHEKTHRLTVGHVGMDPEAVARLQVRDLGNGQGLTCACHRYFDFGSCEIKSCGIGAKHTSEYEYED